jgi:peroxin-6
VRAIFASARASAPCILFFDELDSLAPARGRGGDSAGVMDRVVSQLLAEIDELPGAGGADEPDGSGDSVEDGEGGGEGEQVQEGGYGGDARTGHVLGGLKAALAAQTHGGAVKGAAHPRSSPRRGAVFVVAATNRPDLLDAALMRPGRFDRLVYLGVARDAESKYRILAALARKFHLAPDVDLRAIAQACPPTATGADLYAVASNAMAAALHRLIAQREAAVPTIDGGGAAPAGRSVATLTVTHADFAAAARDLVPSVTEAELDHYEQLRRKFGSA